MTGYSVEIIESSKELTAREKISAKDFSNATVLDTKLMDANANIVITPSAYLILRGFHGSCRQA